MWGLAAFFSVSSLEELIISSGGFVASISSVLCAVTSRDNVFIGEGLED